MSQKINEKLILLNKFIQSDIKILVMYNLTMKKIVSVFILFSMLLTPCFAAIQGHVEQTDSKKEELDKKLFTGEYSVLKEDKSIKMTVSQVLSSGYTQVGDEFFAEISQNVTTDKGVVIPLGTIVHGNVKVMCEPKTMGRDGWIALDFDYLITPDGRQIPIQGSVSTKDNAAKETLEVVAEHAGYTALGGLAGGFMALNVLGLEAAIASNGYTIAGGAAIGGAIGLVHAIRRKGDSVLIKPGDELKIKMLTDIELPVFTKDAFRQEELKYEGLDVKINKVKFEKDPFGFDNTITLTLAINNRSKKTFSAFDIAMVSDLDMVFHASPFNSDDSLWFRTISPGDNVIGQLSFSVNDKKRKHWLVFYDKSTRKPLAKFSVDNANQDLEEQKNKKNKRS